MKIRSLLLTALCAVAGLVSTVSAAPNIVRFAPSDTDLIVRIDGRRILGCKVFKKLRELPEFQKFDQEAQQELAKHELVLDDLLGTELCIFVDVDKIDLSRPAINMVACTPKPLVKKLFDWIDADAKSKEKSTVGREVIDGKEARVKRDVKMSIELIALDDDLLQLAINASHSAALTVQPKTELGSLIDTGAMLSVAYRVSAEAAASLLQKCPPEIRPFVNGLTAASVNAIDDGSRIELKAELVYSSSENADGIRQVFSGILESMKAQQAQDNPELVATLKRLRISGRGNKVIITFACDNEEAFNLLKKLF